MTERLVGTTVVLRAPRRDDAPILATILQEPDVARWWGVWDLDRVVREMLDDPDIRVFVVEQAGAVVGAIQVSEEADPEFRHASVDMFVRTDARGRGLGPDAIRTLARWLIGVRGHHRLTIDPAADNAAAIRAYEKVGFRTVGRLRRYQRMADGTWADGLLMELLDNELVS